MRTRKKRCSWYSEKMTRSFLMDLPAGQYIATGFGRFRDGEIRFGEVPCTAVARGNLWRKMKQEGLAGRTFRVFKDGVEFFDWYARRGRR